jgi:hypothetical protein
MIRTNDGIKVIGEDFVTAASGLSSLNTNWATVAGFPVSPYSFGPNTLSDMARTHIEWRCERLVVCYVPAVGTSSNGQVAIYHKPNRADPHVDPTSAQFYNFVLSQRTGVVGPVWQPCLVEIPTSKNWRSTVPLEAVDINDEADGEVFMATNNNVASGNSPSIGILKIQYIWHFRGMQRNPRQSLIPLANQVYYNVSLGRNGASVNTATSVSLLPFGNDQSGTAASGTYPGFTNRGTVYKFIIDTTRSSFGAATPGNLFAESAIGTTYPVALENGFTCYLWSDGGNAYPCKDIQAAMVSQTYFWGLTNASLTFNLVGMVSLVGTTNILGQSDI